jgi:uncharacterized protein (TIGR03083 family)
VADLAEVYDETRRDIVALVEGLDEEGLATPVPATPEWSVHDVICHLTGDVDCILQGDFPREFFESFGSAEGVVVLNEWTEGHLRARRDRPIAEVLEEWDSLTAKRLLPAMRGESPWPDGVPPFADRVLITDLGVHQQDLYGAFGIERNRDGAPIKIGSSGYIVTMGLRLASDGIGTLTIETPEKSWEAGTGEPRATVRASRYEFFRALSGRRSMDQVRAYGWVGDAEPFLPYFFPYGVKELALVE